MNAIQAVKDYFVVPETGMPNGKRTNYLIISVSAIATGVLGSVMAAEYITEGEVSCLGLKCINLISIAALESAAKHKLLRSFDEYVPGNGNRGMRIPAGALSMSGVVLLVASITMPFYRQVFDSEELKNENAIWINGVFIGACLLFYGVGSIFANHRFRWQERNHNTIEF